MVQSQWASSRVVECNEAYYKAFGVLVLASVVIVETALASLQERTW